MLALNDDCRFSNEAMEGWKSLISQAQWGEGDRLTIISFKGTELGGQLFEQAKNDGIPVRLLRVSSRDLFSLRSGIVSVPMTMILNQDSQIEWVCSGALGERELELFSKQIGSPRQDVVGLQPRPTPRFLSVVQL